MVWRWFGRRTRCGPSERVLPWWASVVHARIPVADRWTGKVKEDFIFHKLHLCRFFLSELSILNGHLTHLSSFGVPDTERTHVSKGPPANVARIRSGSAVGRKKQSKYGSVNLRRYRTGSIVFNQLWLIYCTYNVLDLASSGRLS